MADSEPRACAPSFRWLLGADTLGRAAGRELRRLRRQRRVCERGSVSDTTSGAPEAVALEDSFFNQASNWKGERYRAVFETAAVDIKGVTVELRTAMMWESIGALPQGTVSHAMASGGWTGVH